MKNIFTLDPHLPVSIDSAQFLYEAIGKEINAVYAPTRDALAILAGCYLLKKILPLPYYAYRLLRLYVFPYRIHPALVKINSVKDGQWTSASIEHDNEHWALINDCTTPSGCAFAQNLARRGYNLILVSTEDRQIELKSLSFHIEKTFSIRTVTVVYRWTSPDEPLELTSSTNVNVAGGWSTGTPPTVGQVPLRSRFHRAGSFDRLDTIETIARNGNLVLFINCTRPLADENLVKTSKPFEFQSMINNQLIPPIQLANIVLPYMSTRRQAAFFLNVVPHPSCLNSTPHRLLLIYFTARQQEYSKRSLLHFQTVYLPISWLRASTEETFPKYILSKHGLSETNEFIWGSCKPRSYVEGILRQLGRSERSSGYWLNALHLTLLSFFPKFLSHRLIDFWLRPRETEQ